MIAIVMATSLNVSIKFKRDRRAIGIDDGTSAIPAVEGSSDVGTMPHRLLPLAGWIT